jgi:hypothetical protein
MVMPVMELLAAGYEWEISLKGNSTKYILLQIIRKF